MEEPLISYATRKLNNAHVFGVLKALIVLAPLLGVSAQAAVAKQVSGVAKVVDGDTLDIDGARIRLEGIDAPERGQRCNRAWLPLSWHCGRAATRALKKLTKGQIVRCHAHGTDAYNRMIGVCFVQGQDINAEMVRRGHAWAFVKYSTSYLEEEQAARREKRGIWHAKTETAWAYRGKKWKAAEQTIPQGCPIKGNISPRGRVYHMPWSPWYRRVRVDTRAGERWFCSEEEARAAGWRPVAAG